MVLVGVLLERHYKVAALVRRRQTQMNVIFRHSARFVYHDASDLTRASELTIHYAQRGSFQAATESSRTNLLVASTLTLLAFLTRFYKINNPDEVVSVTSCWPFIPLLSLIQVRRSSLWKVCCILHPWRILLRCASPFRKNAPWRCGLVCWF